MLLFNISERMDMLFVKHCIAATKPCEKYVEAMDDILDLPKSSEPQLRQTMAMRKKKSRLIGKSERVDNEDFYIKKWEFVEGAKEILSMFSLLKWKSFLEHVKFKILIISPDMYRLFTFGALHNPHLGSSKTIEEIIVPYLSSHKI